VPKRDIAGLIKGWRVCIDPRPINLLLPSFNYPLPLIKDILEALKDAVIFSRIDLAQGFCQFQVNVEDQEKTTFTWNGQQYCFVGAPFGFKHIPAQFQQVLSNYLKQFSFVKLYIDDIIIFSRSLQEHIEHVQLVLNALTKANLKVNPDKCEFARTSLVILYLRAA
jgi:hypothetical protein